MGLLLIKVDNIFTISDENYWIINMERLYSSVVVADAFDNQILLPQLKTADVT